MCGFRTNTQTTNGVLREYSSRSERVPIRKSEQEYSVQRIAGEQKCGKPQVIIDGKVPIYSFKP